MSDKKQISAIAQILRKNIYSDLDKCTENCEGCICVYKAYAKDLYNKNYRLASEVSLNLISEISKIVQKSLIDINGIEPQTEFCNGCKQSLEMVLRNLEEFKEKFMEENKK